MNIVADFHNFFFNLFYTNFKLFNYQFDEDKKEIHLFLEPKDNYPQCPICKNHNVVVHEYRHRIVKDGSYNGFQFILHITYRTFKCKFCDKYATVVVDLDTKRVIWVGKGKTVREVNRFFKLCGT